MTKRQNQRGFTLIEVLLAILISSVAIVGVLSTMRAAVSAYQKMDQSAERPHEARLFLALMEMELRNSIPYSEAPFVGKKKDFEFPAIIHQYTEEETTLVPTLVKYEYRNKSIYRKTATLRNISISKKTDRKKIVPGVRDFVVQYAYRDKESLQIVWQNSWSEDLGLPRGIQIQLKLEPQGENGKKTEGTPISIIKHVFIPQGNWGWIEKALS